MDAFYASVEQRDNPDLRGKPIAVGGEGRRGVLTTASYEARVFGVRSAMPGYKAKQLCPDLIFVKPRFTAYKEVSNHIRKIFSDYTDLIEPLSLDEAFLDVSNYKNGEVLAMDIAKEIKDRIRAELNLTASAGVSYCKFVAKIASDIRKPDGLTVIHPERAEQFIAALPIEQFFGVGKVTAQKMKDAGIFKGADLKMWDRLDLIKKFGKSGEYFYHIVRGIDNRPVRTNRERKSLAAERTLMEDANSYEVLALELDKVIEALWKRIDKSQAFGKTLTLKLKDTAFKIITRSQTMQRAINEKEYLLTLSHQLLEKNWSEGMKIRLIGLSISNFEKPEDTVTNQLRLDI